MPHNEASVKIPDNNSAIFKSRPFPEGRPWGSLCAMVRDNLRYLVVEELSRPDLLVLQLPCCYIVAGYVAPASSKACTRAVTHPFQYFSEAVTFLVSNTDLPLAGLTDVNGRIGTRSPVNAPSCCSRLRSIDTKTDARGSDFIDMCHDSDMVVLNGLNIENIGDHESFSYANAIVYHYPYIQNSKTLLMKKKKYQA